MNQINNIEERTCLKCKRQMPLEHNYCSSCGTGWGKYVHWYYKHWGIILLILLLGPFAMFFVILSPVVSKPLKWIYTLIVAIFTIFLVVEACELYRMLSQVYKLFSYSSVF